MRILNLYACLGGNRYKWDEVSDNLEVTAVELDPELARLYQERFPNDKVIIADAHDYLLNHYKEFDFIWSSPPCPTHSKARFARAKTTSAKFPDLKLYEEIIFLNKWFKGKSLLEHLDNLKIEDRDKDKPLRFNILDRFKDNGNFVFGKVEQGTIIKGQEVLICPYKKKAIIEALYDNNDIEKKFA